VLLLDLESRTSTSRILAWARRKQGWAVIRIMTMAKPSWIQSSLIGKLYSNYWNMLQEESYDGRQESAHSSWNEWYITTNVECQTSDIFIYLSLLLWYKWGAAKLWKDPIQILKFEISMYHQIDRYTVERAGKRKYLSRITMPQSSEGPHSLADKLQIRLIRWSQFGSWSLIAILASFYLIKRGIKSSSSGRCQVLLCDLL
jgi:hypothetical protein